MRSSRWMRLVLGLTVALLCAPAENYYKSYRLDYHEGEEYPHLVRDESKPDLLSDIIKPHAPPAAGGTTQ